MKQHAASPLGIDLDGITPWFGSHLPDLAAPLVFAPLTGGRSNLTYRVSDVNGCSVVLRRPPLGELPRTAHDVLREARLLEGLATQVPVPTVLGTCDDPAVTGAPFVVLEHIDGMVVRDSASAAAVEAPVRPQIGRSMIDALVRLHSADPVTVGLGKLAERDDFAARQLRRWDQNWRQIRTRDLPELATVHDWLVANIPPQRRTTVIHGDFRLDNCILDSGGTVAAILDWELSTVGDPLTDLGQLLMCWAEPGDEFRALHDPPTIVPGFSGREELRTRYLDATGADPSAVDYFVLFNWWKMACIVEDVYSRVARGSITPHDRTADSFAAQASSLAARAVSLLDQAR